MGHNYSDAEIYRMLDSGDSMRKISAQFGIGESTLERKKARRDAQRMEQSSSPVKASTVAETPAATTRTGKNEYIAPAPGKSRVLAISDMHHPFCHQDTLEFLKAVRDEWECNEFVCLGDEADFHAFSRYPMDPDGLGAGKELQAAIDALTPFYIEFPNMKVCESNHTVRPMKKMWESGLPAAFLPTYAKMMNAPDGWQWAHYWMIDGVRYHHGDAGRSGQFAPAAYMKVFKHSNVHGHLHSTACVMYEGDLFGINAGCLIDRHAYAFKYAKNVAMPISLGCAVVIDGVEGHFIPMIVDQHNRWIGR